MRISHSLWSIIFTDVEADSTSKSYIINLSPILITGWPIRTDSVVTWIAAYTVNTGLLAM